jgi:hypothetical protein
MGERKNNLVHGNTTVSVSRMQLFSKCETFQDNPALLASPYYVQSPVGVEHFKLFVAAIGGADPEINHENSAALIKLCTEFKFVELGRKAEAFAARWAYLTCKGQGVYIEREKLVQTCGKFRDSPALMAQPYTVTSNVAADVFQAVVNAINGETPTITNENATDIALLCEEFGHQMLSAAVSEFLAQHSSAGERAWREVVALKAQVTALTDQVASLSAQLEELRGIFNQRQNHGTL